MYLKEVLFILELKKIKDNSYIGLKYLNELSEKCNIIPPEILDFKVVILFKVLVFL